MRQHRLLEICHHLFKCVRILIGNVFRRNRKVPVIQTMTFGNFPGEHDGVYVSPNVFNSVADMAYFADTIRRLAKA